jgi:hypothetical protein
MRALLALDIVSPPRALISNLLRPFFKCTSYIAWGYISVIYMFPRYCYTLLQNVCTMENNSYMRASTVILTGDIKHLSSICIV